MHNLYFCSVKILVVRFSSIGDIVLTTALVRALQEQVKQVEIHYLTKATFASIVHPNPYIHTVHTIDQSIDEVLPTLKELQFDWVIDLHNNIRTKGLKTKLRRPSKTVRKLNWKKWLLVNLKINRMPNVHIVDRYFETVAHLGVKADGRPGEFFIEPANEVTLADWNLRPHDFVAIAIGAQRATKCLPEQKIIDMVDRIDGTVVLIGGPTDVARAEAIVVGTKKEIVNTVGKLNLQQSTSVVKKAKHLITHDTGMMHIASCFDVPMATVWGNTVPDFGMYPYQPNNKTYSIHEVQGLACRPCSKIGSEKCPKGHFKCMVNQDLAKIVDSIHSELTPGSVK